MMLLHAPSIVVAVIAAWSDEASSTCGSASAKLRSGRSAWPVAIHSEFMGRKRALPKPKRQRSTNRAIGIASSEPAVPLVSAGQHAAIVDDLEAIARGEELDMPWRRVRRLLDLGLAEIQYPVMTAGSRRALSLTDAGLAFFDRPRPLE